MSVTYLGGDFPEGTTAEEFRGRIVVRLPSLDRFGKKDWFTLNDSLAAVEAVVEENRARLLPKVGWAAAGAVTFGPLGALAGAVLGGWGK